MARLPALEKLIDALARRPEISRVWLYRSRARGDNKRRSDIDIAIEAPGASRLQWTDVTQLVEEADTLLPIDLVRIEEVSPALRARIVAEGKILCER